MAEEYLSLEKLDVYKLSRELSSIGGTVYKKLDWNGKKAGGDQFFDSVDSVGANVAEGSGRFHYLDKAKFYYNVRGSLLEARHWLNLLAERGNVAEEDKRGFLAVYLELRPALNGLIGSVHKAKEAKDKG